MSDFPPDSSSDSSSDSSASEHPQPPLPTSAPHPPSPCISICEMNPQTGYCQGCARTIDEIARWATMNSKEKQAVLDQLENRFFSANP
ncbi:MAG: DUF1289 domain-containing protein [Burkholderiaceae bacterium]